MQKANNLSSCDAPSLLGAIALKPGHLDVCKDVCNSFGVNTVLMPCVDPSNNKVIQGFAVKLYRNDNTFPFLPSCCEYEYTFPSN